MKNNFNRRDFIRTTAITGLGLGMTGSFTNLFGNEPKLLGKRVGIIGLDTSHSIAFAKTLNAVDAGPQYKGYKVVAAYPQGSKDIESSTSRVPAYIEEVQKFGVEMVYSIDELITRVDVILLESNDGRVHLEQALPVLKAGKRMFIDKPVAGSLSDTIAIFEASQKYHAPVFSTSSLRYMESVQDVVNGKVGKVFGADTFSPAVIEPTHPDLLWYGIHGIETLFAVMGKGCTSVSRTHSADSDLVVGTWEDGRIGSFRGIRNGKSAYGGTVHGEKGATSLGPFDGYDSLLLKIVEFFETGVPPVSREETIEVVAFAVAADESKEKGGAPVNIVELINREKLKYKQ